MFLVKIFEKSKSFFERPADRRAFPWRVMFGDYLRSFIEMGKTIVIYKFGEFRRIYISTAVVRDRANQSEIGARLTIPEVPVCFELSI